MRHKEEEEDQTKGLLAPNTMYSPANDNNSFLNYYQHCYYRQPKRQQQRNSEANATTKSNRLIIGTTTDHKLQALLHLHLLFVVVVLSLLANSATGAMNLPDGIENVLGFVPKSSFQCERDGYFGDVENDCRIFHLCQKQIHSNGRTEWRHWTYACGNQTMFNQLTLTCAFIDEAIPCRHAPQFQYLNEVIHRPKEPFLTDADVTSGFSYYSNRIMSDGARARAFEDSQLMAQIGGHTTAPTAALQQQQQPQQQQPQQVIKPKIVAVQAPRAPQALDEPERRQQWSQPASQNLNQQQPGWFIANSRLGDQSNAQPDTVANNLFEPFFANQQQHQQQQQLRQQQRQQQQQQQPTSNRIIENRLLQINHNNNNNLAAGNFVVASQPATTTQFQTNFASAAAPQLPQQPLQRNQRQPQTQPQQHQQQVRQQQQQHQAHLLTTARPAETTFAAPLIAAATNDQHQSEQSAPASASVSSPAVSSRAQVDSSDNNSNTNNQTPQSFEFTLTTDHRLGSSNVHHSQLHFQQPTAISGSSPAHAGARSGNLFASNPFSRQQVLLPPPAPPVLTTTQSSLAEFTTTAQTTPSPTTETVATTSQQGVQLIPTDATTTAALERALPATTTTTTTAAPTTMTTTAQPTTTTTTGAPATTVSSLSARQIRRRQHQQQTGASGHMAAARWQSTRLTGAAAAAARQARQSRPDNGEPLLLRRQAVQLPVRATSLQVNNSTEQVTSNSSLRSSSSLSSTSTTTQVWPNGSRASLVEPAARFESLITRRRV